MVDGTNIFDHSLKMTQEHMKILKKLLLTNEIFLSLKMSDSEVGKSKSATKNTTGVTLSLSINTV